MKSLQLRFLISSLILFFALSLFQAQETQARLLSLELESYQFNNKPYKRYGAVFEVWPASWFTLGIGVEPYSYKDENEVYDYKITNTQPLLMRFALGNFYFKAGLLESHREIKRSPTATSAKVKEQLLLSGNRISTGFFFEWNHLMFSLGMLQESLPEQKVQFDSSTSFNVGGNSSAVLLSLGVSL